MTFKLEIVLGNDAMQTAEDVADALRHTSNRIIQHGTREMKKAGAVKIWDRNGNSVGQWEVTD